MLLAIVVLACGGGDGDSQPAATAAAEATQPSAALSPEPAASPTAVPEASPTEAASGGVDLQTYTGRLPDLAGYRYDLRMEGTAGLVAEISNSSIPEGVDPETGTLVLTVAGTYVGPDRGEYEFTLAEQSVKRVVIDNQAWTDVGEGFGPPTAIGASETDYSFVATFWDESPPEALADFTCEDEPEVVNGVETTKCTAGGDVVQQLNEERKLFTIGVLDLEEWSGSSASIWVTESYRVISFRAEISGADSTGRDVEFRLSVDVMDVNADLSVEPPA